MRKLTARSSLAIILLLLVAGSALAQNRTQKSLEGKVLGSGDAPLINAIVYLQDTKTNNIRSFYSTADGSYRFGQLSPDIDYQVWAQYKDVKSSSKTVSSFDARKQVIIDLHVKAAK